MKKLIFLLLIVIGFSSCVLNRTYISDYREQIRLMKANFPEIYELYRQGDVIITSVYTYEKDGQERVHIEYRYRYNLLYKYYHTLFENRICVII